MPLRRSEYPSDLTDEQWKLIRDLLPEARRGGRPRSTCVREVVNALFYLNRTGCAWRYLPKNFPPWQTVYDYFSKWRASGTWRRIHAVLRRELRLTYQKKARPTLLIADSQSVRAPKGESRGFDGYKHVTGRKRQILVDTLGLVHAIKVHAANLQDRKEGAALLDIPRRGTLKAIYADRGYSGYFCDRAFAKLGIWPRITSLQPGGNGNQFVPANKQPKRWIVERTFSWFNHYRRLAKDYEKKTIYSESMIEIAMTQLMVRRLCKRLQP